LIFYTNVALKGSKILLRAIQDGERKKFEIPYRPYLFMPSKSESEYHTLAGKPVEKIDFESAYELREFIKRYEGVDNFEYYGMSNPIYTFINDNTSDRINYDASQISVVTLDIEVDTKGGFPNMTTNSGSYGTNPATKEITAICLRKNGKNVVFGMKDYISKPDTEYVKCDNEIELLQTFLTVWDSKEWTPDVLTGWNCNGFDIPYLVLRISLVLGENAVKLLSPWRHITSREFSNFGKIQTEYKLTGIATLDYMALYKKFSYTPQESYRLDNIAFNELKERKIDYSQYKSMAEFYEKDFQKFIDYNINDCVLVDKLEEKKGLIKLVFAMAYDAKVNFEDCFTPTRIWDSIIHSFLMKNKIVVPKMNKNDSGYMIEGAFVKDAILGLHTWVVSYDLNSLYPHLMMEYNISPETYVDTTPNITVDGVLNGQISTSELIKSNVALAATGCTFERSKQGFIPKLVEKMYADRIIWKKKMLNAKKEYEKNKTKDLEYKIDYYKNMQWQIKITLNALYGSMQNEYFRWYNSKLAESITKSGQVAIRWVVDRMNKFLNEYLGTTDYDYVIACDTDSMYLRLEKLVNLGKVTDNINENIDFLIKECDGRLEPVIKKAFEDMAVYVNAYANKMEMKRETIANKGIWVAKKHYILNAYDIEGVRYKEPELKAVGIEIVKSTTPQVCRDALKEALKIIMNKSQAEVIKFIADFKEKFYKFSIEEISMAKTVNGLQKYSNSATIYGKGAPLHVKGTLIHNYIIKKKGLTNIYELIMEGEKIKYCYLRLPNPLQDKIICFMNTCPKELGVNEYIDYELMFEKSFLNPLENILQIIGWESKKYNTIMELFE
jgi:DNA polymerase elongation subunit (family B)